MRLTRPLSAVITAFAAPALALTAASASTSSTTVEWPATGMRLDIAPTSPRGTSTACPSGRACAFQSTNEGGAQLSWRSCGTFSTTALPSVGSVASRRASGSVQARNGTMVIATAPAGNYTSVFSYADNVSRLP